MTSAIPRKNREVQGFAAIFRRDVKLLLIVAAVAAVVRIVYLVQLMRTPFPHHLIMDAATYDAWALDIAAGNWLGNTVFYQEPLYPYVLAVIHTLFGPGLLAVYVIQAWVGVVNCVLTGALAARVTGRRWAGLIAGLILALYGPMVFYEAQVLKVVWAVLLLLVLAHVGVPGAHAGERTRLRPVRPHLDRRRRAEVAAQDTGGGRGVAPGGGASASGGGHGQEPRRRR